MAARERPFGREEALQDLLFDVGLQTLDLPILPHHPRDHEETQTEEDDAGDRDLGSKPPFQL